MSTGTREAAFVHALSSAAVAVAVTQGCSRGELERCGCDRKVRGVSPEGGYYVHSSYKDEQKHVFLDQGMFSTGFQWSGCSDNLSYGVALSQTFVDEPERAKGTSSGRPLMNIHNNEAGRKVSLSSFVKLCHNNKSTG